MKPTCLNYRGIIEYPNNLVNYLVQVIGVEFIGCGALFIHVYAHLFKVRENEVNTLIYHCSVPDQAVYGHGQRIVLVVADTVSIESGGLFFTPTWSVSSPPSVLIAMCSPSCSHPFGGRETGLFF